jgi:hypothetical protein
VTCRDEAAVVRQSGGQSAAYKLIPSLLRHAGYVQFLQNNWRKNEKQRNLFKYFENIGKFQLTF